MKNLEKLVFQFYDIFYEFNLSLEGFMFNSVNKMG